MHVTWLPFQMEDSLERIDIQLQLKTVWLNKNSNLYGKKNPHFSLQTKLCISPSLVGDQREKRDVHFALSLTSLKVLHTLLPLFLFQL